MYLACDKIIQIPIIDILHIIHYSFELLFCSLLLCTILCVQCIGVFVCLKSLGLLLGKRTGLAAAAVDIEEGAGEGWGDDADLVLDDGKGREITRGRIKIKLTVTTLEYYCIVVLTMLLHSQNIIITISWERMFMDN